MKMSELDKKFDEGEEDILDQFDLSQAERVNHEQRKIDIGMPVCRELTEQVIKLYRKHRDQDIC